MSRLGWLWIVAALVALSGSAGPSSVAAQEEAGQAGLAIVDGSGAVGYAVVTIDEGEISGIDLLRQAGAEPVTVSFGGLGEGVCGIGETGCAVDACRRRMCQTGDPDSPYWQVFALTESGTWAPLPLGASTDRVRAGEVRVWAWTAGVPELPPLTLSDISQETGSTVDAIVWEGRRADDSSDSSVWLGVAAVMGAAALAWTVRGRSGRLRRAAPAGPGG